MTNDKQPTTNNKLMSNHLDFTPQGYRIDRELEGDRSRGRFTYLATDTKNHIPVIIKQFQFARSGTSWTEYEAHYREIELLKQLDHPHIPCYLSEFETPSGLCLVQEYKSAPTLARSLHFTLQEIKEIALGVLEILVYLQQQNPPILHGDIKPENILVDRAGKLRVYLVDFGSACQEEVSLAGSATVKGTLGFMPPEQIFKRTLTKASDLYSLGATLICLLTQTRSHNIGQLIDETNHFNLKSLTNKVSRRFISWLAKMVAPNLKDRFSDAATALAALKPISIERSAIGIISPKIIPPAIALVSLSFALGLRDAVLTHRVTDFYPESDPVPSFSSDPLSRLIQTGECPDCNLRGVELKGANLEGSRLFLANLEAANLQGAQLQGANLQLAQLSDANLQGIKLQGANLEKADFTRSNLNGANLEGANLVLTNLQQAQLQGVNLNGASLQEANLQESNLKGANLENVDLHYANLEFTLLDRANLRGANLDYANLSRAYLNSADMQDTNLEYAYLKNASLAGANLEGTNLKNASLEGANLQGANLKNANLEGANLTGANLEGAIR
jgi:uncharacterized protein YjbI with pentapeptide repeats